ncbi:hypothetical protein [Caulobacter sp. Root1472]|uniref:hypothetical protein n=1 Tax=Caulobacter sp. Root1472 TaxID=1736470 RepID=UPI0012E3A423|nr:hypothetical protein [Caulobacter sp. Root1472]
MPVKILRTKAAAYAFGQIFLLICLYGFPFLGGGDPMQYALYRSNWTFVICAIYLVGIPFAFMSFSILTSAFNGAAVYESNGKLVYLNKLFWSVDIADIMGASIVFQKYLFINLDYISIKRTVGSDKLLPLVLLKGNSEQILLAVKGVIRQN